MGRKTDYPRASLKNCIALADAIDDLGGSCSSAMAADKLNKQLSGAFSALISAAVKFGLINNKKAQLSITELYKDIKLAYDEDEAQSRLQKAFLAPELFNVIYNRFSGKTLPIEHFDKLLMREFEVPENYASRIVGYFLEGAKQCGLLEEGNTLTKISVDNPNINELKQDKPKTSNEVLVEPLSLNEDLSHPACAFIGETKGKFSVRIQGPGIDSLIVVNEEEDLLIVQAMLKKVEKRLLIDEV